MAIPPTPPTTPPTIGPIFDLWLLALELEVDVGDAIPVDSGAPEFTTASETEKFHEPVTVTSRYAHAGTERPGGNGFGYPPIVTSLDEQFSIHRGQVVISPPWQVPHAATRE